MSFRQVVIRGPLAPRGGVWGSGVEGLPATSVSEHFATLSDPRVERCRLHPLEEIVTIAPCGVLCVAVHGNLPV